jgi:lysophospholipase L1-like esterase
MKKTLILFCCLFLSVLQAQQHPFYNDIQEFKKQDSILPPAKNCILFIGSSSFTNWKSLQQDFPNTTIINRGFGGSTLQDMFFFKNDILNYSPSKIVWYCGENDIASSEKVTPKIVLKRFKKMYKTIRHKFPTTPIAYLSIKPSIARWNFKDRMIDSNNLIQNYAKNQTNIQFISVWNKMLEDSGNPKTTIYLDDNLHMNAKGYQIWIDALHDFIYY